MEKANLKICSHTGEIAAYLDGELTPDAEISFERHVAGCDACAQRLNEQKRLLCALDFAFEDEKSFELPKDFVKTVAVRAESDVSGLNTKEERYRAILITAVLFAAGFLFGIVGNRLGLFDQVFAQIKVFFGVFWRIFTRQFSDSALLPATVVLVLIVFTVAALSVLFIKHRRA